MAELEARIVDLEAAIEVLEDDAVKWAAWWDAWKSCGSPAVPSPLHDMWRRQYTLRLFSWVIHGTPDHESADAAGINTRRYIVMQEGKLPPCALGLRCRSAGKENDGALLVLTECTLGQSTGCARDSHVFY